MNGYQRCNSCYAIFKEELTECPKCGRDDCLMYPFEFDPKDYIGRMVDVEPRADDEFEHEFRGVVESYDEWANLLTVRDQDDEHWCVYPSQVAIT